MAELMTDHLSRTWFCAFGALPHEDVLDTFTRYASQGEEESDRFFALLFESSTRHFRTEGGRSLWLARQISEHKDEAPETLRAA